ncbi:glycoside hydrolase family 16 protein [Methylobacterium oryzihabitans]|uniref:Glycoside hydrolase family 16 protein n=1 Tax=Methylobacterium oryzihabitans TaxID=2499852 RepID=A0A3S3U5A5_9HYPH|nr:glycoside hydrolase family 16 protein [Methylobacterium oryzihabitans]RVU15944.1 glycoside hydrolase family 16 protein [Methylobacterium oryzihabitans]
MTPVRPLAASRRGALGLLAAAPLTVLASRSPRAAPPPGWHLAFDEPFDRLDLGGRWEPHYPEGWRTNAGNRELEYYVDPRPGQDPEVLRPLHPFHLGDGVLRIRANPVPEAMQRATLGLPYASGLLTTYRSFAFRYGYAEMRARVPRGRGLWPAFWLLARAGGWPPEIDVMEVYGDRLTTLDLTLHTGADGGHRQRKRQHPVPDLSGDFHTYAVTWTRETVAWAFDGETVFSEPTPADLHQPMFLLVNLAVGGTWTGAPDAATAFPADFAIDRIRVFTPEPTGTGGIGE